MHLQEKKSDLRITDVVLTLPKVHIGPLVFYLVIVLVDHIHSSATVVVGVTASFLFCGFGRQGRGYSISDSYCFCRRSFR
jgi:hypothetical protein